MDYKNLLSMIKRKYYGFNIYAENLFNIRLEMNNMLPLSKLLYEGRGNVIRNLFIFNGWNYNTRHTINILLLNFLGTYKGWRHSKGLPVRGQRTWSNGWGAYKSNTVLRSYKINMVKKYYNKTFSNDYFIKYLAEETNKLWKLQWETEWKSFRSKRLNMSKNPKNLIKVDLLSMSKVIVKLNIKKKQPKNIFTSGFEIGFTKARTEKEKKWVMITK